MFPLLAPVGMHIKWESTTYAEMLFNQSKCDEVAWDVITCGCSNLVFPTNDRHWGRNPIGSLLQVFCQLVVVWAT
jgi:hypothetical protein